MSFKDDLRKLKDSLLLDLSYWTKRPLRPTRIYLGITPKCILRCQMCDIWQEKPPVGELTTADKLAVLKKLRAELGPFEVSFYGGEPVLKFEELVALTEFCSRSGIRTQFNTNAYLLDERRREAIAAAGVNKITLSLDALEPEVHDQIRGVPGAYLKVREAIAHFLELRRRQPHFDFAVFSVLMQQNLEHMTAVARFCREQGIEWDYQEVMGTFAFGHRAFEEGWWAANPCFIRDLKELDHTLTALAALGIDQTRLRLTRDYFSHPDRQRPCAVGLSNLVIDYQGNLKFCFMLGAFGTWRDPILATWRGARRARLERRKTLECTLPCSILQCNIYQPTWSKIWQKIHGRGHRRRQAPPAGLGDESVL